MGAAIYPQKTRDSAARSIGRGISLLLSRNVQSVYGDLIEPD